ncbi:MAG: apolipoprotein acyltransferase [Pseudomonadota bacterium]
MIVLGGGILGAIIGAVSARKRGGNRWDMAQYAAGYGIAFMLLALILNVILLRIAT